MLRVEIFKGCLQMSRFFFFSKTLENFEFLKQNNKVQKYQNNVKCLSMNFINLNKANDFESNNVFIFKIGEIVKD